jgi:acetyltransferase
MGLYHLEKIFRPRTLAVIGASDDSGSIGRALLENLDKAGFPGEVYPVNPNHDEIMGQKAHPEVTAIDGEVDLAVIATPIKTVPEIIRQCAEKGMGGAIVVSAGGREAGEEGERIEEAIASAARKGGVRIIGPNCLGVICPGEGLNASFAPYLPEAGNIAFISQSGAICTSILDLAMEEHFGFSHFVSIGSMLDVDFGDLIDYLGNDSRVKSILLYVESLTHIRKFMSAARAVSRVKPIVALKAGSSSAGAEAAASHTGAMAGSDAVYDAAFKRAGIVRVKRIGDLFDCAELLAKQPRPKGGRLGIVTNGGGPGVMAADALEGCGLSLTPLSDETRQALDALLPDYWSRGNPVDVLGDAPPDRYAEAVGICLEASEFDAILALFSPQALTRPSQTAGAVVGRVRGTGIPVFTAWVGGREVAEARQILNDADIPTYGTPENAIRAFKYLHDYARNLETLTEIPPKLSRDLHFNRETARDILDGALSKGRSGLSEAESKRVLSAYGIPVNRTEPAGSADTAVQAAERMGYPVAMKIDSPDIGHKSEENGVRLDIWSADEVRRVFSSLTGDEEGRSVTVQSMIPRPDFELLVGAKQDPSFGPALLFGLGGVYTEIIGDREIGLPPLNRLLARRIMEETKVYTLLKGYRGRKADLERLEEVLIRLSQLVIDLPEIEELDMNPMVVKEGNPTAVDARIVLRKTEATSPHHLVISPYPEQYVSRTTSDEGRAILVRPIQPEDAPLFEDLFDHLSKASIYRRFFRHIKSPSREMIARFTQIDYDREMALAAIDQKGEAGMVGVARIMGDPDGRTGEFSAMVGDRWQGQGIGAILLWRCLAIMKERSMERVWGTVMPENKGMLRLGKKLGFEAEWDQAAREYLMTIELTELET